MNAIWDGSITLSLEQWLLLNGVIACVFTLIGQMTGRDQIRKQYREKGLLEMCSWCHGSGYADYASVPCDNCAGDKVVLID